MAPSTRNDAQLNLNLSGLNTMLESQSAQKPSFAGSKAVNGSMSGVNVSRMGAGSPLHEQTSRLFPKRTRELQTALQSNIWGPPTSGTSTPLYEIPESPNQDGFPDLVPLVDTGTDSPARRARAGTLPSRISPIGTPSGLNIPQLAAKTSRPTPSASPFRPGSTSAAESAFNSAASISANSTLLSRLRAGSMPQRSNFISPASPFGQTPFGSTWGSRTRAATLTSINSSEDPASPQQHGLSRDSITDLDVRTLDYLGLAEPTPQQSRLEHLHLDHGGALSSGIESKDPLASFQSRNSNRFRSFSVNTQPRYGEAVDTSVNGYPALVGGTLTPSNAAALEAEYELVQEKVRLHNEAVQAYAINASAARPRARTAGLVEAPQRTSLHTYTNDSGLAMDLIEDKFNNMGGNGMALNLNTALQQLNLTDNLRGTYDTVDESDSHVSRSLWIGSIPNSTTMSSLDVLFNQFGSIESTRVLTHKNCGFVNFINVDDAVRARHLLNGKEIFPGAGPVRIGYAKAPTGLGSAVGASNGDMTFLGEGTPDDIHTTHGGAIAAEDSGNTVSPSTAGQYPTLSGFSRLNGLQHDIMQIVAEFGAQHNDLAAIATSVENALAYQQLQNEIPSVTDSSSNRLYDAPRLRDIRKRIDNGACGLQEIEQTAIDMLPEIAELASDYLGNTVIQKLFEYCSEQTKEQMLMYIAPHLAEIGVHKNGTWAAQKIIDVCKTEAQISIIVDSLRPYTVPLFLDQYGNYVVQCCLRFGSPYNDFIFETMLSQLVEISQGRFGARAMRACLESHHATKHQQRMLAALVALSSVELAQNTNGALLLTWLLDTCTLPRRRSVLAPRLLSNLTELCTHKVAYLTVLKLVNQRNEPEARDMVIKVLFFSPGDYVLEKILNDQASGATLVFKILTTPFMDENVRVEVVRAVSKVLLCIKAQSSQGYKRLMDEVGLSSRGPQSTAQSPAAYAYAGTNDRSRPYHQSGSVSSPVQPFQRQLNSNPLSHASFEKSFSPVRSGSADSFAFPSYGMNGFQPPTYNHTSYQQMTPQIPYTSFSPNPPRNNMNFMPGNFAGYSGSPSSIGGVRNVQHPASPLAFSGHMSPGMGSNGFGGPAYSPQPLYGFSPHQQQQPQQHEQQYFYPSPIPTVAGDGGRGRRVSALGFP